MKKLFFNILTLLLIGSCFSLISAQVVSGTITDGQTQESIIGATVLLKGTTIGSISDIDGSFTLEADLLTDTLMISYIGYETIEEPISGRTSIDISMALQSNKLDEIVVVGYGRQKKRLITGAISRVDDEQIKKTPILRVEQALQGRTAGVQVTSQSGQPGDEPTVRVRGIGTTKNAKPLYIVDGLAVGGIDYLNPGDIETIDVLKDAASAAIYGSRAANGVILITTKSGSDGKMTISYDGYRGFQNATSPLTMLNADQYKMIMNEGARNANLSEPFDLNEISDINTDWQNALFQNNVPMESHQLSISGGNKISTFSSSLSYFTQQGIIGGNKSQFDRYTGRLNSSHKLSKKFRFGNNLAYTHLNKRGVGVNTSFNGPLGGALNMDPLTPVYETDPIKLDNYPYNLEPVLSDSEERIYGISEYVSGEVVNPLALLETNTEVVRKDQIVGNVFAEFEPIENLVFKTSYGLDLAYVMFDSYKPLFFLNGAQLNTDDTSVNKRIERYFTWQWTNTVNYQKEIGDHTIGGLAGVEAQEFAFEDLSGFNAGVPVDDPDNVYLNLATDTTWRANGGARSSSLYSLFGRLNYSYKDKYSVTAVMRRDGSSKFGRNNRFGYFPSVGVAWVASDEEFLQNLGPVNYLKFRLAVGVNGNQEIGDYQFVSRIIKNRGYNGSIGASPLSIENQDIGWEESRQFNIGTDFGLFENRLQGSIDYYIKTTEGLLEKVSILGHVGNDPSDSNVGSIENKGVELSLNYRNNLGSLNYSVGINGAYNKNTITFIGNPQKVITGASWATAGAVTRSIEGLPIAYFWGYETAGIFQNEAEVFQHINADGELLQPKAVPGDVRFVDANLDGIINEMDRTDIGNPNPDITYGINLGLDYKGFDLGIFLQGVYGNEIFNGTQRQDLRYTNRTTAILDRWTGEGTSNSTPRYTWSDINNNYRVSDLYIEDGSFMRLKNVQIGYALPQAILDKIGATRWRFYISGENLATFTSYTGVDPEIGALDSGEGFLNSFDIGIDRAVYPQARTIRFGTNLVF